MILDLSDGTRLGLDELAKRTDRSVSALASEAIDDFVARELAIIEAIQRGLEDAREGRVTPHAEAMRLIREAVRATEQAR